MVDNEEAEFVVMTFLRQGEAMSYFNRDSDFGNLLDAQTYSHADATLKAKALAARLVQAVWIAPLLFGIPDMETAECFQPG